MILSCENLLDPVVVTKELKWFLIIDSSPLSFKYFLYWAYFIVNLLLLVRREEGHFKTLGVCRICIAPEFGDRFHIVSVM